MNVLLISTRLMLLSDMLVFFSACSVVGIGVVSIYMGLVVCIDRWWMWVRGVSL